MTRETAKREGEGAGISPTVMAHVFRGELSRSDTWRTRLDTTTNWALTTTAAVISFAFSSPAASHVVLLVGFWMVMTFLMIEARRYRYYDLWNRRVRLIEGGYWAPLLRRESIDSDAMRELAAEMARPQIQLSLFSAMATRMNRAYGPILLVLLISWFVKVYSHPRPVRSWEEFFEHAHLGPVPGAAVVVFLFGVTGVAALAFFTALVARPPLGELKPRPRSKRLALWEMVFRPYAVPPTRRPSHRRERSVEH
ncbi:MAG TPA: DUF2270 domain-containing protein [Myxococcaceae bacterium]|nr:DUF2270 domain-containing protein [Myxococcaceae bacterium]